MSLPSQTMAISLCIDSSLQSFIDMGLAMTYDRTDDILPKAVAERIVSTFTNPGPDDEYPPPIEHIRDIHTSAALRGNWVIWIQDLVRSWRETQEAVENPPKSSKNLDSHLAMLSSFAAKNSRSAKASTMITNLIMVSLAIALYKKGKTKLQPSYIKALFEQENDFREIGGNSCLSPTKVCFGLSPLFLCAPKSWCRQTLPLPELQTALTFSAPRPQAVRAVEIKILECIFNLSVLGTDFSREINRLIGFFAENLPTWQSEPERVTHFFSPDRQLAIRPVPSPEYSMDRFSEASTGPFPHSQESYINPALLQLNKPTFPTAMDSNSQSVHTAPINDPYHVDLLTEDPEPEIDPENNSAHQPSEKPKAHLPAKRPAKISPSLYYFGIISISIIYYLIFCA
ncbi:hypothetical protein C8J56DRAFT_1027689, partial [Mycena floridula]